LSDLTSGPAVEVRDLYKIFRAPAGGEVRAVDGVSFTCASGEIVGLLGPNGAGKTTALRILATILQPTSGTARVAGRDVQEDPDGVRRRLGFVSSSTGVYERLTGRETEMEDFCDRICGRLSAGQRQKVSLARAIIHDPPVLVLDEPTANLDVIVARNVIEFVESAREQGRAILLSTHLFSEAERLCDRIVIVHQGKVLARGTLEELRARTGESSLEDAFFRLVRGEDGTVRG